MSEISKFEHIETWLGPRLSRYTSCHSVLEKLCAKAVQSSELPLAERINAIDIAQRHWKQYASSAGNIVSAISEYIGIIGQLGEKSSGFVDAAKEKRQLIESQRAEFAHKLAGLSGIRAGLTQSYLKQEGLLDGR